MFHDVLSIEEEIGLKKQQTSDLAHLITELEKDRAWLLEQIDLGRWSELRLDLASLEREIGQILIRAAEKIEEGRIP